MKTGRRNPCFVSRRAASREPGERIHRFQRGSRGAEALAVFFCPAKTRNAEAASKLADEVACFANTPGGGALILGVEDSHGTVLGTELDTEWLRQRIDEAVQVAPDIVEHHLGGAQGLRVLVLYVPQAKEPVYDTGNKLRWRVGDHCKPVDRSLWWEHRENMREYDEMAQSTRYTPEDIPRSTMNYVRALLGADTALTDREVLQRLGALRSDGKLSQAAALTLCPASRTLLELTIFDVPAGSILNTVRPDADLPLLEQIRQIEQALQNVNTQITLPTGFAHRSVRQVPETLCARLFSTALFTATGTALNLPISAGLHSIIPSWCEAQADFTVELLRIMCSAIVLHDTPRSPTYSVP